MIELLNKRIKQLRKEEGISQIELAKKIGIAKNTLCQYENNKANPSLEIVLQIAKYFNVSTDYLLGFNDDESINFNFYNTASSLTKEEWKVVDVFRAIPDNTKEVALTMLRSLAPQNKEKSALNKRA